MANKNTKECIIIGGGPAGLTAGLYASRAGLKSLLIERGIFGGQIVNSSLVENYPGFPDGISGSELSSLMHQQADKYGLETQNAEVIKVNRGEFYYNVFTTEETFETLSVIITCGSEYRKLTIPGEEKFLGYGVSYCATCDGFLFRDREVAVVGGGDTAITDALELTRHVKKVYVIHRRDQLRASQILQQRAFTEPKLDFIWNTVVEEIKGGKVVKELKLYDLKTENHFSLQVSGLFVAIGLVPNTQYFANVIKLDKTGYIYVDEMMATSTPGIFAAGDIRRNSLRQVAASVGDGATAAMSTFKYVQEVEDKISILNHSHRR